MGSAERASSGEGPGGGDEVDEADVELKRLDRHAGLAHQRVLPRRYAAIDRERKGGRARRESRSYGCTGRQREAERAGRAVYRPRATVTTGPLTYCFVTPATASMGLAAVEMMPEAERMADAGGSMGADARLTVVEPVAVTGTPVIVAVARPGAVTTRS